MKKLNLVAAVVVGMGLGVVAQATPINYTFQENDSPANTTTKLGTSATFTESGYAITANGYYGSNPMFSGTQGSMTLNDTGDSHLAAKYTSGNQAETGLGIWYNSDNEINANHAVTLNLSSLYSAGILNGATLGLGSMQYGEKSAVYGSTDGINWTYLATISQYGNTAMNTYSLDGTYDWIGVTETGGNQNGDHNVLITGLTVPGSNVHSTPDGGTTALLLGAALSGLALLRRKLS